MDAADIWVAARTFVSAGTYLFSLGTSIYAIAELCKEFIRYRGLCDVSCPNFVCGDRSYLCLRAYDAKVLLIVALCVVFWAHTINAFIFAFKFDKGEAPIRSAYFLPLMQLWRLLDLIRQTWSCKGFKDSQLEERNTLFTQLGLSLETYPMYVVQLFACYHKLKHNLHGSILFSGLRAVPISTASSFLSLFFLGGLTVQATAKNVKSFKMKATIWILSGLSITSAGFLRLSSVMTIYYNKLIKLVIKVYEGKVEGRSILLSAATTASLISVKLAVNIVLYLIFQPPRKVTKRVALHIRLLKAFGLTYISVNIGPLYPLVSEACEQDQLGTLEFQIKLLVVAVVNLVLDCVVVPQPLQFISQIDFVVPASVYLISISIYSCLDNVCGKPEAKEKEITRTLDIASLLQSTLAMLWIPFYVPGYLAYTYSKYQNLN